MELTPELQARVERVARELEAGGVTPPTSKELQTRLGFNVLDVLEHLTFRGDAVKVTPELFMSPASIGRIADWLESFFQGHAELAMADLREALGMSRKYSVPVLEHLDRQGWTRRVGDVRVPGRRLEGTSRS